jgi:glycosyltransferase involved in cell wall biosynthesis
MFVCSSLWEGLSTAILEAMATGVPVLATDIPGNRELIKPEMNGWLVPARDIDALEMGIINIYKLSDQQRLRVIFQAQQDVMEYSIDAIADQHSRCYHQLISGK